MPTVPHISVGVCTRQRPHRLATWLAHLSGITAGTTTPILVIDQSDTPYAGVLAANVDYRHRPGSGLATARNQLLAACNTPYLALCDDDCLPDDDWIIRATALVTSQPAVALWYGATVPTGDEYTVCQMHTPAGVLYWATRGDHDVCHALMCAPTAALVSTPVAVLETLGQGNNCVLATDTARSVGGFRPFLGAGTIACAGEDVEYTLRLLCRGYAVAYDPTLRIQHDAWMPAATALRHAHGYSIGMLAVHVWYAWYGVAVARRDVAFRLGWYRLSQPRAASTPPAPVRSLYWYAAEFWARLLGGILGSWYALRDGRPW